MGYYPPYCRFIRDNTKYIEPFRAAYSHIAILAGVLPIAIDNL
jgi:hypothetical protein